MAKNYYVDDNAVMGNFSLLNFSYLIFIFSTNTARVSCGEIKQLSPIVFQDVKIKAIDNTIDEQLKAERVRNG